MSETGDESPEVFFTGFPGFLGSALIERLLDRGDGPIACLVQPAYMDLAKRRAADIAGPDSDAIRLYEGDITEPDIGLGDAIEELDSVKELYHLAAVYDLTVDAEVADAVNVEGTENVLDVAQDLDVDRLQYVSTCYVSGRYDGVFTEDHLQEGQEFNNHYERTKYEAEVLVQERMDDGLQATIYRPAIVVGDSETGETGKYDGPYYLLKFLLAQPDWLSVTTSLPGANNAELNVVPRDFVVDAIANLSSREDTIDEVYQLCDPAPLAVPRFIDALGEAMGHRVVTMPGPKSTTKRLLGMSAKLGLHVEPAALDYLDHPTRYACPNTLRALSGTGIECPSFESYVKSLVAFVRENPDISDTAMT
jgi:thioester reductase-like protein